MEVPTGVLNLVFSIESAPTLRRVCLPINARSLYGELWVREGAVGSHAGASLLLAALSPRTDAANVSLASYDIFSPGEIGIGNHSPRLDVQNKSMPRTGADSRPGGRGAGKNRFKAAVKCLDELWGAEGRTR